MKVVVADAGESAGSCRRGFASVPISRPTTPSVIAKLPEIKYASIWGQIQNTDRVRRRAHEHRRRSWAPTTAIPRSTAASSTDGRWFTRSEEVSGAPVVVLVADVAKKLFGNIQPIDKLVRIGGRPMRVIGIYQEAANIFQPPGQAVARHHSVSHDGSPVHDRQDERAVHSGQAATGRHGRGRAGGGDDRAARGASPASGAITTTST